MDNAFAALPPNAIQFEGLSALAHSLGTEIVFLELRSSAPLSAQNFGIVEATLFTVTPSNQGLGHQTLVNPECEFDEMSSRSLGLSTPDVINFEGWGQRIGPYFEKLSSRNAILMGLDLNTWTLPALVRAQVRAELSPPDGLACVDLRKVATRLAMPDGAKGTAAHLAGRAGIALQPTTSQTLQTLLAQVELTNAIVRHCGVPAMADELAGVTA